MNIVTKRGGTSYHGALYTYQRFTEFNATNFFNNRDGVAKPDYRLQQQWRQPGRPDSEDSQGQCRRPQDVLLLFGGRHAPEEPADSFAAT